MQPPSIWGKRLHPIFVYCTASVKSRCKNTSCLDALVLFYNRMAQTNCCCRSTALYKSAQMPNHAFCIIAQSAWNVKCIFLGFRRKIGRCIFRAGALNDSVIVCISHGNCVRLQQITVQNLTQENGMCTGIHLLYHTACNPA